MAGWTHGTIATHWMGGDRFMEGVVGALIRFAGGGGRCVISRGEIEV